MLGFGRGALRVGASIVPPPASVESPPRLVTRLGLATGGLVERVVAHSRQFEQLAEIEPAFRDESRSRGHEQLRGEVVAQTSSSPGSTAFGRVADAPAFLKETPVIHRQPERSMGERAAAHYCLATWG